MTTEALQRLIRAKAFEPFVIHVADGEQIEVRHPELIAHTPGNWTAHITLPREDFRIVDLLLVTSIGPVVPQSADPAAEGQR